MNIFDSLGKTVFDIMRPNFGCVAKWKPSNGPEISKVVLYKHPSDKFELNQNDYSLEHYKMEYYESDFPGLHEKVADRSNEKISIEVSNGVFQNFIVKACDPKGDGKTIIATLTLL